MIIAFGLKSEEENQYSFYGEYESGRKIWNHYVQIQTIHGFEIVLLEFSNEGS